MCYTKKGKVHNKGVLEIINEYTRPLIFEMLNNQMSAYSVINVFTLYDKWNVGMYKNLTIVACVAK